MSRPLVAIPGRFSASASALRYGAVVTARALSESVLRAGGEPLTVHPYGSPERLRFADAILLPGGGDLAPSCYGAAEWSAEVYDVDPEQDAFDLAVAEWALAHDVPLLAICRGMHVVNVALGGTLVQHMEPTHRHLVHPVKASGRVAGLLGQTPDVSCFHHQCVDRLGDGLVPTAHAQDGTVEAVELPGARFLGVQWHPEDISAHQALFDALVGCLDQDP